MNITEKLKYIQEGYTFSEVNSDSFIPISSILKESDQLFIESFSTDAQYLMEMGSTSGTSMLDHIKRVFKWLRDKVMQFISFIKDKLFSARKGAKKTAQNIKANAHKLEHPKPPVKHTGHKPVDHGEPDYYEPELDYQDDHGGGAMDYRPEDNEIVIFSKILSNDNLFDNGYKKIYEALGKYIERLEKAPRDHDQIISDADVIDNRAFLNRIFTQTLSVPFDKPEIFKKLYGDPITKITTVQELTQLADKLYVLDDECELFANWLQKKLPYELEQLEKTFDRYIDKPKGRIISGKTENYEEDRELIDTLSHALAKVVKLVNMQMQVIQIFASMHANVFMQLRGELEHYDWVLNPAAHEFADLDNNDGIIH